VERRHAAGKPVLDPLDRATLARRVELVEQLLLDAGSVRAGAIRDPPQQVRGRRAGAGRGRVKYLDQKPDVFRSLQDDIVAAHGGHFHEVPPGYTSTGRTWWAMPVVSSAPRFTLRDTQPREANFPRTVDTLPSFLYWHGVQVCRAAAGGDEH